MKPFPIVIDGCLISQVNKIKFLGVIIDDRLTWSEHISYISRKISKSIGILKKVAKLIDYNCMLFCQVNCATPGDKSLNSPWGPLCRWPPQGGQQ